MNTKKNANASVLTKMQQSYWEARRDLNHSLGTRDDDCLVSNDSELDRRIEFFQAADSHFNSLMAVLIKYNKSINVLTKAEENLASALIEYSIRDSSKAGRLMANSGKVINRAANRRSSLKFVLLKLFNEVQTFQLKATVDVIQTVSRMEKTRKAYRSGLMWMKNESLNLDPEVLKKIKKFKKVQEHIKNLKVRFDRSKVECMQKIDLYLFSRCNLFSQNLVSYRKSFCKVSKNYMILTKAATQSDPFSSLYKFEVLKELNSCLKPESDGIPKQQSDSKDKSKKAIKSTLTIPPSKDLETKCIQPISNIYSDDFEEVPQQNLPPKKRVRFSETVEVLDPKEDIEKDNEKLLIDLDDKAHIDVTKMTGTCSEDPAILSGTYSSDLLSISFNELHISCEKQNDNEGNDFKELIKDCSNTMDSLMHSEPQVDPLDSDLQFWCLLESFGNIEERSSPLNDKSETPTESLDSESLENSSTRWEDVLIQFDPFTELCTTSKQHIVEEDC